MKGKAVTIPRGDMIVKAAEAGMDAVIRVLDESGETSLAEMICITALLRDLLIERAEESLRLQSNRQPSEIDMLFAMFGDKLK